MAADAVVVVAPRTTVNAALVWLGDLSLSVGVNTAVTWLAPIVSAGGRSVWALPASLTTTVTVLPP